MQTIFKDISPEKIQRKELPEIIKYILPKKLSTNTFKKCESRILKNENSSIITLKSIIESSRKSKSPIRSITPTLHKAKSINSYAYYKSKDKRSPSLTPIKTRY